MATAIAAAGFVFLYEATVHDSRSSRRQFVAAGSLAEPTSGTRTALAPGAMVDFTATAYCKGTVTASGVAPRSGVAAADPGLLPVGSVIQVDSVDRQYSGVYTVMDTGPAVRGHIIDIYMWSCHEALRFGRRDVQVLVLRHGWDPRSSSPTLTQPLLGWRDDPVQVTAR